MPAAFVLGCVGLLAVAGVTAAVGWTFASGLALGALAASLGVYALGASAAAVVSARASGWHLVPVLPIVFATYHVSYGAGFLLGLASGHRAGTGRSRVAASVTQISR